MITKQEFKDFLEDGGYLFRDILLHKVSIQRMNYPRSKYYYNINKFQKARLIKSKERKKYNNAFILTDAGKSLLKKSTIKKRRTGGLATIIMFDIPEEKTRERNIFRRYLIRNGYTLIQKSALISPLEISSELIQLINELKIKTYIKVIFGKINYL